MLLRTQPGPLQSLQKLFRRSFSIKEGVKTRTFMIEQLNCGKRSSQWQRMRLTMTLPPKTLTALQRLELCLMQP